MKKAGPSAFILCMPPKRFKLSPPKGLQWPRWPLMLSVFALLVTAAKSAEKPVEPTSAASAPQPGKSAPSQGEVFFEREIRPILVERCQQCHGEKKQKGGLRLDALAHLLRGGDSGPALRPGAPEKSAIIEAVSYKDPSFAMPPRSEGGPLTEAQVQALTKWVAMGAPWPNHGKQAVAISEDGFTAEQKNYWAFRPVTKPALPAAGKGWAINEVDAFIADELAKQNIAPAPQANRHELVRRAYFDLHGLPPTPKQIEAFVNDPDPKAYEKLVDDLLASPRYGERWAQHWLDLVRYAESDGYNADGYRPWVWPYRDYVIESLNQDKPYDQFVREQLAGDEINPEDPKTLIATAFLRHPVYEWNQRDARGQWDIILTDMTDTTAEVFLGLSMGCARCHNHKFDPILQKDYYKLRAFLAPVLWRDDLKLATPQQQAQHAQATKAWEKATAKIRAEMDALVNPILEPRVERALTRFTDDLVELTRKPFEKRAPLERQLALLCERQMRQERTVFDPLKSLKGEEAKARYRSLQAQLKSFDHLKPAPLPEAFVATDAGPQAPPVTLKTRKGEQLIEPGFVTILGSKPPQITPRPNSTGRRSALAQWIASRDNPLSTRVIVNRLWQYHFGRGIVATANDFGKLGELPTHPALLEHLTTQFLNGGWRFKPMHRLIMLSAAYQQTARREPDEHIAKTDPGNRLLWRFPPRRLDAEQIRDALLSVSGELDPTGHGPATDGNGLRRSIYTTKKRNNPTELLRALDMPNGFASTPERQSTTTPTQALQLLNGDWLISRARRLATQVRDIDQAWLAVLGRPPTANERHSAMAFLRKRSEQPYQSAGADPFRPLERDSFVTPSAQERLVMAKGEREGDDFQIEAVASLQSIDSAAAVRTLASRWSLGKDSQESFGWSLGVTGEKSRFKPRNLILQLVGEDDNSNIGYQVVASDIHLELDQRYWLRVKLETGKQMAHFEVQALDQPNAPLQKASRAVDIRSKISQGSSPLVIGGLGRRLIAHQWQGSIEALRLLPAGLGELAGSGTDPQQWTGGLLVWRSTDALQSNLAWSGSEDNASELAGAPSQAMVDLCQVLLNTNEFFYLH